MAEPVRLWVVDDDRSIRFVLSTALTEAGYAVSTFASADEALLALDAGQRPALVLADVRMPGTDGLELLDRLRRDQPGTAVVMLTSFDDDSAMRTALDKRAHGFLLKDSAPQDVVGAVLAAAAGGTTISPSVTSRLVSRHLRPVRTSIRPDLTAAEQTVLTLLCEGLSNAEIAERLVVAESTVKTHVSSLMHKYGVASRLKLVVAVHRERDAQE